MTDFFYIELSEITVFQRVLLAVFVVLFFFRIFYRLFFSLRVLIGKGDEDRSDRGSSVSLLITVRNEEENIRRNFNKILKIRNVDFEVIVVDDFSQDNSLSLLGILKKEDERIRVSSLNQETRYSVKLAQNIALKAAKNEWVMVVPVSASGFQDEWLLRISTLADENNTVVLNYSNISGEKGFFNLLYRIENFMQQFKGAGFCKAGLPFVYSEPNIAFRKEKYFEIGGYGQKVKEPFANLELIINSFIKKRDTIVCFQAATAIWKSEKITKADYFDLLKRSIRIENYLSFWKRVVLFTDELSKFLFVPVLIAVIALLTELWVVYSVPAMLLFILYLFIIKSVLNRLNEPKLFLSSLLYDLLSPYLKVCYRWYFKQRNRKQRWKSKI